MELIKTSLKDLFIIKPTLFEDDRGYFMESYKHSFIQEHFQNIQFIQDNESRSSYGILRGLHFQRPPFEQTKLVRVIKGEVLDIVVDIRQESETFGKYESFILNEVNKKQILIPKGFAHGFLVLSNEAIFSYKVDNPYQPDFESGILFNDKDLNIDWILNHSDIKLSTKDLNLKTFKNLFK